MARLLPAALLTRAAVVFEGLSFDVERSADPDAGPILIATDADEGALVVSVTDLGLALSGTLGLRPALPQERLDALVNACSVSAHVARFSAIAGAGEPESVLYADAIYAGAFESKSFERFVEAFSDDVYDAFEIADEAGVLLDPSDLIRDTVPSAEPIAPAPAPKIGTGRLARIPRPDAP